MCILKKQMHLAPCELGAPVNSKLQRLPYVTTHQSTGKQSALASQMAHEASRSTLKHADTRSRIFFIELTNLRKRAVIRL